MMREECREGYQNADHTTWSPLVGHVMADGETLYANQGKQKAGVRLCRGIWDDFPHSDVWYEPASMINHTAAFEAYKRQLAEESR